MLRIFHLRMHPRSIFTDVLEAQITGQESPGDQALSQGQNELLSFMLIVCIHRNMVDTFAFYMLETSAIPVRPLPTQPMVSKLRDIALLYCIYLRYV